MQIVYKNIDDLKAYQRNNKKHPEKQILKIMDSIKEFGFKNPVLVDKDSVIIAGHGRCEAAKRLGIKELPCVDCSDLTKQQVKALRLMDNKSAELAEWDFDNIKFELDELKLDDFDIRLTGFDNFEINADDEQLNENTKNKKLSDRFIIPPFSVLDTKQGKWQQRKNYWLSMGIKSEAGRDASVGNSKMIASYENGVRQTGLVTETNTSIFDPVLCELGYQWFCVPNGKILDPFAGGSVRGIVASKLGFDYLGNDLRQEQIDANIKNGLEVLTNEKQPLWTCGDSLNIDKIAEGYEADFIFSCPPYADLEVYSDLKEDISNMPYKEFLKIYREIIKKSVGLLKQNRFAMFTVGDVRDKKGFYQNFVSDTILAFIDAGMMLYNEMILVNAVGSLAIRAGRQFAIGRKVGKQHQNVLVFYKGDPKKIKENYPELDLSYMEEAENENSD